MKIDLKRYDEPSEEGVIRLEFPERGSPTFKAAMESFAATLEQCVREDKDVDIVTANYAFAKFAALVAALCGQSDAELLPKLAELNDFFLHLYSLDTALHLNGVDVVPDLGCKIRLAGYPKVGDLVRKLAEAKVREVPPSGVTGGQS